MIQETSFNLQAEIKPKQNKLKMMFQITGHCQDATNQRSDPSELETTGAANSGGPRGSDTPYNNVGHYMPGD